MRHRTIGLAAVLLLAAPIAASCTRPPPGGGGVGKPMPGPAAGQQDCGTIDKGDAVTAAETQAVSCFLGYHTFGSKYVKVVSGSETIVLAASGHTVTVSRVTGGTVTKQTVCSGLPNSQFALTGAGAISTSCPY